LSGRARWVLAVCLGLAACGGGGGGGGSREGARVLHGSIDSAPFVLTVSGNPEALQASKFALPVEYSGLPGGNLLLSAASAQGSPVFSFALDAARSPRQTVLIYGSRTGSGVRANLISDDAPEIPSGLSAVRVVHAVDRIGSVDAAAGGAVLGDNVPFGSASAYALVPSGAQNVSVRGGSRGGTLCGASADFASGQAYSVLAAGEAGYLVVCRVYAD
jgi:hypothetical protein